jgi:L-fuculose-phosphate aldolase
MKQLISARDIEELLKRGGDIASLPADALYTPSARDLLNEFRLTGAPSGGARGRRDGGGGRSAAEKPVSAASAPAEIERFFNSPEIHALKEQICDIGRRLWQRAYVDGNGGNISVRVAEDLVLCTPTLVSKGFMRPEELCLVDMEANQKAGTKKGTSEIRMHLAIYLAQPKARACVHCHPPYATGFAVAGVTPPTCMVPEIEVFVGEVAIAPYLTPGTWEMGREVAKLADNHNTILMANHGVVAWSHNVEDAYFKMEILEAYCRTVLVTTQLGKSPNTFTPEQLQELLKIKQSLGIPDRRLGLKECQFCDNSEWRPGVTCAVAPAPENGSAPDPDVETLVQQITDRIMNKLKETDTR